MAADAAGAQEHGPQAHARGLLDLAGQEANDRLRELGLLPLTQKGGTIKREVWESLSLGNSPFQEAARILKLGTPQGFL